MVDRVTRTDDVYFINLPALVAGGFTPATGIGAGWIAFEHTLGELTCTGLATGANSEAGELVLDLGLSGWYELHLCALPTALVWLDGDPGPCELQGYAEGSCLRDFPLPPTELTGKRLHIAPRRGTSPSELTFFYLRAVPCAGPREGNRNLIAANDGHGCILGLDTLDDLYARYFAPLRKTDFFRILWGNFGGGDLTMNPRTVAGERIDISPDHAFYAYETQWASIMQKFACQGIDLLEQAVKCAHAIDLEIHLYVRPSAFYWPFPHEGTTARFYREHPEWRCRDEFGRETRRMSYAFPEVRAHMLAFFDELLDYDPDGLCLAFNRSLPLMICEEPVLDAFRQRYGRAPRLPDEVDSEEMLAVRHEILYDFLGQVHDLAARRGKVLSCIIPRNLPDVRLRGLDIERSARAGHFESVVVGAGHGDPQDEVIAELQRLQASGARVYSGGSAGGANGGFWPPSDLRLITERMSRLLDAGLGGYFWDIDSWFARGWDIVSRCGDRQFLANVLDGHYHPPARETVSINGMNPDRYNPWWSF